MQKVWPLAVLCCAYLPPAAAQVLVQPVVEVQQKAKLLKDGAIRLEVHVTCEPFGDAGENNVTVTQDEQRLSVQRSIGAIECDGKRNKYRIEARALDGTFHEGPANVSAFVSQINTSTSEARQGQDSAVIEVR